MGLSRHHRHRPTGKVGGRAEGAGNCGSISIAPRRGARFAFPGLRERWTPEAGEPVVTFAITIAWISDRVNDLTQHDVELIGPQAG